MKKIVLLIFSHFIFISCTNKGPEPIKINKDMCDFCKMTISNGKFASELITKKGRIYKFDDVSCMVRYVKSNTTIKVRTFYVGDYSHENKLVPAEKTFYLHSESIASPMRGNVAAFQNQTSQNEFAHKLNAQKLNWEEVYNRFQ